MSVPKINRKYDCFDDGKIRQSRHYIVLVNEIIPFDMVDKETLKLWETEVKQCYWLYRENTDYFIKTINEDGEEEIFVRTKNDGWFSMGRLNSGRLDIDGTLMKILESHG